ncbi:MAG: hypothetical protein JWR38_2868 [Mucilaginibacter sp.]|nr:hypothetical protein [Mucilaginibacter sp.]
MKTNVNLTSKQHEDEGNEHDTFIKRDNVI